MRHFRFVFPVIVAGLILGGWHSASLAQDEKKQPKPVEVNIADEDKEVAAYFKTKGWELRNNISFGGYKWVNSLVVDSGKFAEDDDLSADDIKMIARSKSVQVLHLYRVKTSDEMLKAVVGITQLKAIIVSNGEAVTEAGIKALAKCDSLDGVSLANMKKVTDAGLKELATLPKLQRLTLMFSTLDGSVFEAFANSKSLMSVELSFIEGFTDEGAKHLAKLPNLSELNIHTASGKGKLTAAGIRAIVDSRLPAKFEFDKKLIDDALLESLIAKGWLYGPTPPGALEKKPVNPKGVTSISLDSSKVTDKGFEFLLPCINTQSLFLARSAIGDETLKKIAVFKKLSYLTLDYTKVTAAGLEAIAGLPIKHLSMEHCEMSEEAFKAIGKITSLEQLHLGGAKLKGEWLKHISTLTKLKNLNLASTDFDDDSAKSLTTLANLEKLNLQTTRLGDAGFQELVKLPKLKDFYLDDTKVTKEIFQKAKKDHPKIYLQNLSLDR